MKVAVTFLALVAVGYSAPQPRKLFHEHYEDFANLIMEEVGPEVNALMEQYSQYEEFQAYIDYVATSNFRDLVYEMEDIPEFKAVVDYLENHDIDIKYYIDEFNSIIDSFQTRHLRNEASGRDATAFIKDYIALFPKEKLIALYEEKVAEYEEFRLAMESFDTEEWNELYSALWQNETFLKEVEILKENGIDVAVVISQYKAILGKGKK